MRIDPYLFARLLFRAAEAEEKGICTRVREPGESAAEIEAEACARMGDALVAAQARGGLGNE